MDRLGDEMGETQVPSTPLPPPPPKPIPIPPDHLQDLPGGPINRRIDHGARLGRHGVKNGVDTRHKRVLGLGRDAHVQLALQVRHEHVRQILACGAAGLVCCGRQELLVVVSLAVRLGFGREAAGFGRGGRGDDG